MSNEAEDKTPLDLTDVEAPTHLDGTPIDPEEAASVRAKLISGEMKIEIAPGAIPKELEDAGFDEEAFRQLLINATAKRLS